MTTDDGNFDGSAKPSSIIRVLAVIVSLVGIADSVYLTVHHYTAEPVPCSLIAGCEQVLTSEYAEIGGIPLAAFGAAAYFLAFSLALLSVFGSRTTWSIFGVQVLLMAIFTGWLIYVQAVLIGAFCQFCLLSAATTYTLLILFLISLIVKRKSGNSLD
jgi:Predicted membrane protein